MVIVRNIPVSPSPQSTVVMEEGDSPTTYFSTQAKVTQSSVQRFLFSTCQKNYDDPNSERRKYVRSCFQEPMENPRKRQIYDEEDDEDTNHYHDDQEDDEIGEGNRNSLSSKQYRATCDFPSPPCPPTNGPTSNNADLDRILAMGGFPKMFKQPPHLQSYKQLWNNTSEDLRDAFFRMKLHKGKVELVEPKPSSRQQQQGKYPLEREDHHNTSNH